MLWLAALVPASAGGARDFVPGPAQAPFLRGVTPREQGEYPTTQQRAQPVGGCLSLVEL